MIQQKDRGTKFGILCKSGYFITFGHNKVWEQVSILMVTVSCMVVE